MPKKLLIVVSGAKFFLSHRLTLAKAAQQVGYEVHVATPPSPLTKAIIQNGLNYHCISMDRGGLNPVRDMLSFFSLYRLYKRIKPDLVHLVTIKPILYGGIAARLAGVPAVVYALTGLGYLFISKSKVISLLRKAVQWGYKTSFRHRNSKIIFQNNDDRYQLIEHKLVAQKNTVLIPGSGVDMQEFIPTKELTSTPLIILASRLLWDKGIAEFVATARSCREKKIAARFALVGAGDDANPAVVPTKQLKAWVKEGVVEWWGECTDMPAVMRQAHVVCLPSYREGLPRVLVEAAASARAIVTSDTPGCRDVVVEGENGLLVPVKDARALAEAIIQLVNNPVMRQEMGKRGREHVENYYALDLILVKMLSLYELLLSASSSANEVKLEV